MAKFIVLARRPKTGRITDLQVKDSVGRIGGMDAISVIQHIRAGHTFHVKDANGAEVVWGLSTEANGKVIDNLGELPEF